MLCLLRWGFFGTLNQRAVGSTPTRPTKFLNYFRIFLLGYVNLVPTHPDFIVLDLKMPGMDGLTVLQ